MILKKIIFIILTLFMLSWAVSPAFANKGLSGGEPAVPNNNGVKLLIWAKKQYQMMEL
jgi:hypothetical protein